MRDALAALDADALRLWGGLCVEELCQHRVEINTLNVFPVADSDTGTNMLHTMRAAVAAVERVDKENGGAVSVGEVAAALSRGAVAGARGNSGVILSQVLRGVSQAVATDVPDSEDVEAVGLDGRVLRDALDCATGLVVLSVSRPVEGTILTVLRAAAHAANTTDDSSLASVASAATSAAAVALDETTNQLSVLRDAGVVDAGARGLLVLLDALVHVVTGAHSERRAYTIETASGSVSHESDMAESGTAGSTGRATDGLSCHGDTEGETDFEVMYQIADTDEEHVSELRARLDALGDSVVVVGDGSGVWSVHVHCWDAGAAVGAGLATGTVSEIRIACFALDEIKAAKKAKSAPVRIVLALVAGEEAAELFAQEGARVLRSDKNPGARGLRRAITGSRADQILILPNGGFKAELLVSVVAEARDFGQQVLVLPSSSMVQGLAALAVHESTREVVEDAFAMAEAAAATRWGSLRVATSRALTMAGTCEVGDALGLVGREVVLIAESLPAAGIRLLDLLLATGGELVTVLTGAHADASLVEGFAQRIRTAHPGVELLIYAGGQTDDVLQLGVE